MNYFRQIIFPPIPKVEKEEETIISFGTSDEDADILNLRYWFEYTPEFTKFMVRCPICSKTYCYSRLTKHTTALDIKAGIADNVKYFLSEWAFNCPNIKKHTAIEKIMGGLI